jgi:excisionase family DNA binding protein
VADSISQIGEENLLTRDQVAVFFQVNPRTVYEWARSGRLVSVRTPGGHRRYRESDVRALLAGEASPEGARA